MSVYRLDELGWYQFERLCQALLKTAYGAALEVWGGTSGDLGRDAYSGGQLRYPDPKVIQEGPFVFQVKHVAGANAAGADPMPALIKAVSRERARIVARLESGAWKPPRFYTLLTNVNFTPDARDQVAKIIQDSIPESEIVTTGAADIEAMLDANPSIRSAYPQVLGIRDLEALIKDAVAADVTLRSAVSLQAAEDLSRVFVATTAYFRAIHVLSQHAFVVLTGPPEMGKTAIARMIALAKATDGWDPIDCRNSADIFRTYDPQRNQLFLADDAFGSTEYRADLASEWATDLDRIIDLGNASHWVVLTSRPGPLREGLSRLHFQGSAKKFPSPAEVQVDTERLSVAEKAQMLYRHAKAAQLSDEVTGIVKTQATQIVHNDHFTPLRIERLVTEQLPIVAAASADRRDDALRAAIVSGLEQPTQQMRTSLVALTEEHRCLLYALLAEETTPARLDSLEIQVGDYLGHPPTTAIRPLAELIDDHFIRISTEQRRGVDVVDWVHPSVRDSVIEYLIEHDLERSRFLRAASYPAVLVAISIGGGREGTLTLPLIRTDADWELAEKRVAELVTLGDGDHRLAILQGLLAVIGDSSTTAEQSLRLRRVGARALKELGAAWSDTGPASLPLLSVYFRLSVAARELVPSPDLTPLWDKHLGGARRSLNDVKGSLGQFDAWLDLVFLLRWAEPRFLRIVGFPKDFLELLLEFVERAEQSLEQLEDLDEDELEDVEIGDGDYESFPVEPGPDEATDRQWVEQLVPMLESLSTFLKDQEARLDTAVRGALEHSTTRETRQDRWDSYTSYEQESDGDWRSDREPERFDIVSFFADL